MIQETYQKAMLFAGEKHKDQLVPGTSANYLVHISNVAMEILVAYQQDPSFDLESAVTLALLHDTLEDTDATFMELADFFGEHIAIGVEALTKQGHFETKAEKMEDSLNRICGSFKEVKLVKLADRITNLQRPPIHWTMDKIKAYWLEAKYIHTRLSGFNPYLEDRLDKKIADYTQYFE